MSVTRNCRSANPDIEPGVDIEQAEQFLALLDPDATEFTFLTFDDSKERGDNRLTRTLHGTFAEHRDDLMRLNHKGAGVFVSLNATDGTGRKSENITRVRAVSVDLDGAPIEPVRDFSVAPHIEVESSPGKFHAYWLVKGLRLDQFPDTQRSIAKRFDGDTAVAALTLPARLPGFFHNKAEPFQTRILRTSDQPAFTAAEIIDDEVFPPLATPHRLPSSAVLLDPDTPAITAEAFVGRKFTPDDSQPEMHSLRHYRGRYYLWHGAHWESVEDGYVKRRLQNFMRHAMMKRKGVLCPFNVSPQKVNSVEQTLRHALRLETKATPPFNITSHHDVVEERGLIAVANGLLDIKRRRLRPHRASYFNVNSLPFAFDPEAPRPERWFQFLHEVWPDDRDCRRTLAEIMGLLLTGNTSFHKAFLIVGPPRSGKGVIGRIMDELYGAENVAHPNTALINTQFGMAPLVDKPVAIISDARVDKGNSTSLAERLLSISGEDRQTVDVKYEKAWNGKFTTRFVIMSNELPRINDASGALASRFVILTMKNSFFGREDHGLTDKLIFELPGILNWALNGLARLYERKRFEMPESSLEQIQVMEDLSSPIKAFLRDRCIIGLNESVKVAGLFEVYKEWCEGENHRPLANNSFGRSLRGLIPTISTLACTRFRRHRVRCFNGTGGWSWRDGSLRESSSLKRCA